MAKDNKADIFASETAVAAIMTANKSIYSWDVKITTFQNKIFIDTREEPNMLDRQTINETSAENQPADDDSINSVKKLMKEATDIHNSI